MTVRGGQVNRWRLALTLAATAAVVLQVGACGQKVAGTPRGVGDIETGTVGGLPITNGPNGPRDGVPDAKLEVENSDGGEFDRLAINAVSDLYDYWTEQMPANFPGEEFKPLERLVSYDYEGEGVEICGANTAGLKNAFYCGGGGEDAIAWDRGGLLPDLNEQFGPMSIVAVLAHEMGHAVQFRLMEKSNINNATPTIVREQQADCYMGNFFRYVAEDKAAHFQINTSDGLNQILATLFSIRDPAGLDHRTEGAHGLAFDRVYAFQEGFSKDPKRCAAMDTEEIDGRISERERSEQELESEQRGDSEDGQVDITDPRIQDLLKASLDEAFKDNPGEPPAIEDNGAQCQSGESTRPAAYCQDEHIVAMDLGTLEQLAEPPAQGEQPGMDGAGLGDFAAFAEIASRYALAVQKNVGAPLDDESAGLRTACLTGAWAKFTAQEGEEGVTKLSLAIGDLDEAVAELLQDDSLIAADVNGKQVESGFARVEAFRMGYFDGAEPCTAQFK